MKQGSGIYYWADGSHYRGEWRGNSIDGLGIYIGSDGRWFKGCWSDAVMHGRGMYTWADGRVYRGEYALDKKEGFGTLLFPDGRRYDGYWKGGRQHGYGRQIDELGCLKFSYWSRGKRADQAPSWHASLSSSASSNLTAGLGSVGSGASTSGGKPVRSILRSPTNSTSYSTSRSRLEILEEGAASPCTAKTEASPRSRRPDEPRSPQLAKGFSSAHLRGATK